MNSTPPKIPSPKPDPANLDASELASNQEARPVPWFCGTRKLPLTWITSLYNLHAHKIKSPPPGISQALNIGQWIDPGGTSLAQLDRDVGKGGDNRPSTTAYYATIAGIPCLGPVDELVAVLFNSAIVWPTRMIWNDGVIDIPTARKRRVSNVATLQFVVAHGLRKGNKFIVSGLTDAPNPGDSFNEASATTILDAGSLGIKYTNAHGNLAWTDDVGGLVSKVVHYDVNDLVRDRASIWKCILAHDALPNTRPPNGTYWVRYIVDRGSNPNPFPFTINNIGQGYLYWGTDTQTLDAVGEKILALTGHPPYRNQVVLVIVNCLLGSRPSAPNIEVILRRKPNQTVITGDAAELDEGGQANPLPSIPELL